MMITGRLIRVLLVNPLFPASFWSFREAVKLLGLKATMPPTGLATVAAMLPADRFLVLPILDLNVEPMTPELLERSDLVMFTAMIAQRDSLRSLISLAKAQGKTVVVGGPYATSYAQEVLVMGADHLVLGEAEQTFPPFLEDFLLGRAAQIYDPVSVQGRIHIPLSKKGKPLLSSTPVPRWDLLRLDDYSSLAIQFSRGCPFNCNFCDIIVLFGHEPRTKTPEQMIAELAAIRRTGWRGSIFIVDDNFIGNKAEVREFLAVLIRWQKEHGYPFSFFTEVSLNLANDDMRDVREMMIAAGFKDIFCGIETPNPAALKAMGKSQNQGDLSEKVRILQAAGFEVMAGFIIGNDADEPTVFEDQFRFIQKNGIVFPMIGLLTALRGTGLYRQLLEEGRLRGESSGDNTHGVHFNFKPRLDEQFLSCGYLALLKKLFDPRYYYERCRILRRRRGPSLRTGRIHGRWLMATLRVFYRNLVKRPDREFFRFILETIFTAPRELPGAVTQVVKLEHFRQITEAAIKSHGGLVP